MKQMKFNQTVSTFLVMSACFFALPGCQRQEGPMEQAGKEVDQAVDSAVAKAGQQIETAGEHVQDAAKGDKL